MSDAEEIREVVASTEPAVEEAKDPPKMPAPVAIGNEKIAVLKHNFSEIDGAPGEGYAVTGVDIAIRNVSDSTIATAVFEAVFYDPAGNILDTVKHKEVELRPETSRLIHVSSSIPVSQRDEIGSYDVRLGRTTTVDAEKVQLLRYQIDTIETGEEEVKAIVKNISEVKTDAAVVVTFYNAESENIAVRVLILKDMEPNTARQGDLRFRPQEGDTVGGCSILVGEVVA